MNHFFDSIPGFFTYADFYRDAVQRLPERPRVVEVGCFAGRSSAYLGVELENHRPGYSLWLVDIFRQVLRSTVQNNLRPLKDVQLISHLSWEAAKQFPDASLDMVFIDADHSYEPVARDIDAWVPKVKPGGILAGHDHCDMFPGVIKAVAERFKDVKIHMGDVLTTSEETEHNGKYYPVWERL